MNDPLHPSRRTAVHRLSTGLRRLAATTALLASTSAFAQGGADRPVTLVVGYAAGGATDIVARLVAKSLTEQTGQPFVVENRAGANSNIGAEVVAQGPADGRMLYLGSIANTINRTLYRKLNYDLKTDFRPVGMLASISNVLVVNPALPVTSVDQYIAYAKANPGKLTCASSGSGSSIHMSCELFKILSGTDILHIPYRGSGPAVVDLLGGQVDSMFDNVPSSLQHVKSGKLRPLAVTAAERLPSLPEVPTFAEVGVQDFVVSSWFGILAPARLPDAEVGRLNKAVNRALETPEIREAFDKAGFMRPSGPNTPEQFGGFIDAEIARWSKVVKTSGASVD